MEQITSEYYIVGGFTISKNIVKIDKNFKRKNMVNVPAILQYYKEKTEDITFYINSMCECIFVCKYGHFKSFEEMQEDYKNLYERRNSIIKKKYAKIIQTINSHFMLSVDDVDWIMTINKGKDTIESSYMILDQFTDSVELSELPSKQVIVIDSLMIYQSTKSIANFFKTLSQKNELSKFEQYQISFYIQELKVLENPDFFLTNIDEINLTNLIYNKWNIKQQISMAINIALQSLTVFEFVANNREKNKTDYSALIMSFLSLLLLYEPLTELIIYVFSVANTQSINLVAKIIMAIISVLFAIKIFHSINKQRKEKKAFKTYTSNIVSIRGRKNK